MADCKVSYLMFYPMMLWGPKVPHRTFYAIFQQIGLNVKSVQEKSSFMHRSVPNFGMGLAISNIEYIFLLTNLQKYQLICSVT